MCTCLSVQPVSSLLKVNLPVISFCEWSLPIGCLLHMEPLSLTFWSYHLQIKKGHPESRVICNYMTFTLLWIYIKDGLSFPWSFPLPDRVVMLTRVRQEWSGNFGQTIVSRVKYCVKTRTNIIQWRFIKQHIIDSNCYCDKNVICFL